ncbi:hypothetical protein JB92DRAFT_3114120 [Gautieria morchelliformis]|nr:hypothetical protein JB92DRAFT_3114120 [Gautieria morchelliformis]
MPQHLAVPTHAPHHIADSHLITSDCGCIVWNTNARSNLSLTIDMEDAHLESFILILRECESLETWHARATELIFSFQCEADLTNGAIGSPIMDWMSSVTPLPLQDDAEDPDEFVMHTIAVEEMDVVTVMVLSRLDFGCLVSCASGSWMCEHSECLNALCGEGCGSAKGAKPMKLKDIMCEAQQKGHLSLNNPFVIEGSLLEAFTNSTVQPQRAT